MIYNAYIKGGGGGAPCPPCPPVTNKWTRPADWLTIPSIGASEQVCYFLYFATDNDSNYVAFKFLGAYTVDWGNGNITNYAGNSNATQLYDYSTLSNPITEDGISYKQVLIKVTPQAGQNLTVINTTENYGTPVSVQRTYRIKEVTISMPNATTFTTGGSATKLAFCEHINFVNAGASPNFTSVGVYLTNLKKISFTGTPAPASLSSFLNLSYGYVEVDEMDYSSVTSLATICGTSRGFTELVGYFPLLTTMLNSFNNCFGIRRVEVSNSSLLTNISSVANGARGLVSFKILDASAVTTTTNAFTMSSNPPGCSLEEVILGGITVGFSVNSLLMSAKTLDAMFTALGTASGSQTIDVRNNPGSTTCDPSIATAKGFTVTTV